MKDRYIPTSILILSFFLACCGRTPSPPRPGQAQAFALVREQFAAVFPGAELHEPEVYWWDVPCPGTDTTAVVLAGTCFPGIYRRPGADVAWRGSIGHSAYSHELMHAFLDETGQDP